MDQPLSFKEFIKGRVCKGDQARYDYEEYLRDFYSDDEEEE